MHTQLVNVATGPRQSVHDLTTSCERFLGDLPGGSAERSQADGLLHVFAPHATAGVAVIETGAGSEEDLLAILAELLPEDFGWRHRHGSPGHGRDHVLPAFVPPDVTLPVLDSQLKLGTWQRVCLVDTNKDNRDRTVRLSFLPA